MLLFPAFENPGPAQLSVPASVDVLVKLSVLPWQIGFGVALIAVIVGVEYLYVITAEVPLKHPLRLALISKVVVVPENQPVWLVVKLVALPF